jgi:hypothetical protein
MPRVAPVLLLVLSCGPFGAYSEMSFLERQQELAKQMWEDEQTLGKGSAPGGGSPLDAAAAGADEDAYEDEYYDDYYEEEPEPIKFVPKAQPKRKAKGYTFTEAAGFQDILKPIKYIDLLATIVAQTKCHSDLIDNKRDAAKIATAKLNAEKPTIVVDVPQSDTEDAKPRKLTFREKQELKAKERQVKEKEAAKPKEIKKYEMGASCEDLICTACGAVVEEFGHALKRESENPKMLTVEDVARGFCGNKEVRSKYGQVVEGICKSLFNDESTGHLNVLLRRFEETLDWDKVSSFANIYPHVKGYCTEAMLCQPEYFEFKGEASSPEEEDWSDECFTCHAIAGHLEVGILRSYLLLLLILCFYLFSDNNLIKNQKILCISNILQMQSGLYSLIKDPNAIVRDACDRLRLPEKYDTLCRSLLKGGKIGKSSCLLWTIL